MKWDKQHTTEDQKKGDVTWDLCLSSTGAVRPESSRLDLHVGTQDVCKEKHSIIGDYIFGRQTLVFRTSQHSTVFGLWGYLYLKLENIFSLLCGDSYTFRNTLFICFIKHAFLTVDASSKHLLIYKQASSSIRFVKNSFLFWLTYYCTRCTRNLVPVANNYFYCKCDTMSRAIK